MDLQKELHPYKVHPYTYVSALVNFVLNPLTYQDPLFWFSVGGFIVYEHYYPFVSGVLLLAGIVLAVKRRSIQGILPGLIINVLLFTWGIIENYPLSTAVAVPL